MTPGVNWEKIMYDHFARNTRDDVAQLGLGCAAIGQEHVSDDDAQQCVRNAWEAGIRTFDVAPMYGAGRAEVRLGRALAGMPRDTYSLSTKVGRLVDDRDPAGIGSGIHFDFSADGIRRSLEASLARLGVDRIDLVLIHDPDNHWHQAITEAWPVLEEWRAQGVVRAVGAGMNQAPMLERFARETTMDVFLVAGRYTLLDQTALDGLFPICAERGMRAMIAQSLHGGLIESDPRPTIYYQPVDDATKARVAAITGICHAHGIPTEAVALRFPLGHPVVHGVLTGPATPSQLPHNLAWWSTTVPPDVWTDLQALGLLGADVPVPGTPSSRS